MKKRIRISVSNRTGAWMRKQAALRGVSVSEFVAETLREYHRKRGRPRKLDAASA
jgi:hypothetical protein